MTPLASSWGNGCSSCPPYYYGVHDAIARSALAWVEAREPARAEWIADWYVPNGGDYAAAYSELRLAPTAGDSWLGYTDDPDSTFGDWANHMFIVHPRPGYSSQAAPDRVAVLYERAVANLTLWKLTGVVVFEHAAAYNMGLLSHYVGDMSQFGHTDDTYRDHSHPSYDPQDRTYHGYYESVGWTASGYAALDARLDASPGALTPVDDVAGEVESLARWVNARDGTSVQYTDRNGRSVTVGKDYAFMLDRFVAQYNANARHQGMRGWDAVLWEESVESTRGAVSLLARLVAQADRDADLLGTGGFPLA